MAWLVGKAEGAGIHHMFRNSINTKDMSRNGQMECITLNVRVWVMLLVVITSSRIDRPPCWAVCRRWCCVCRPGIASRWISFYAASNRVCWPDWSAVRCGCADRWAGRRRNTRHYSSWPRTASAQWSSPSRISRNLQWADNDSTVLRHSSRRKSDWAFFSSETRLVGYWRAPPGKVSAKKDFSDDGQNGDNALTSSESGATSS